MNLVSVPVTTLVLVDVVTVPAATTLPEILETVKLYAPADP